MESEIEQLTVKLSRLDGALHALNAKLTQERMKGVQTHADVEAFTFWLYEAERRIAAYERRERAPLIDRLLEALKGRSSRQAPTGQDLWTDPNPPPSVNFRYFIRQSPFRLYREPTFTLEGWGFPESGVAVTGLRARVDAAVFFGTYGVDEPPTPEWHGVQPNNPNPGFKIIIDTPVGRRRLSLEVQLGSDPKWMSFLSLPIWCVGEDFKP